MIHGVRNSPRQVKRMGILGSIFAHQLVGLDLGVSGIKAVELSGKRTPRLVAYNRIPLPANTISPDGELLDPATAVTALKRLFEFRGFSSKRVAVGASGKSIITKKITVPKMSADELNHQLYWEAEQYIPFNIADVNLDFAIIGNSANEAGKMDVLIVAAKKDYIQQLTSVLTEAGLQAEVIDNQAFALGNAFEFNYSHLLEKGSTGSLSVLLDFGAGSTKVTVVEGDRTTFTRELRQSGISCTQRIAERVGVDFAEAEKIKLNNAEDPNVKAIIQESNHSLVEEISRTIDFVLSQSPNAAVSGIYACGGACRTMGLIDVLEKVLPVPTHALNPIQSISGSGKRMNGQAIREISYLGSVAIGLSLRTSGDLG